MDGLDNGTPQNRQRSEDRSGLTPENRKLITTMDESKKSETGGKIEMPSDDADIKTWCKAIFMQNNELIQVDKELKERCENAETRLNLLDEEVTQLQEENTKLKAKYNDLQERMLKLDCQIL